MHCIVPHRATPLTGILRYRISITLKIELKIVYFEFEYILGLDVLFEKMLDLTSVLTCKSPGPDYIRVLY